MADAPHLQTGRWAEQAAARFLAGQGLVPVDRNFRCRHGEIDLVMADGDELVFVEVRFRADERFGAGFETVTHAKRRRLTTAARVYLSRHHAEQRPCRFDVVSVTKRNYRPEIHWVRDAFSQDD
ncbi:MAG: YraN family protein [Pseudomonadales bacterium]